MSIETYKTNRAMREAYYRMNGITHVEAWDSDDGEGYFAALCGDDATGWPQRDRAFYTIGQVNKWQQEYCPELPFYY